MFRIVRRFPATATLLLGSLLVTAGCGDSAPKAGGGKAAKGGKGGGAAPVLVTQAQNKVVPLVIEAIGAVEPIRTTAIRSQVTGILLKRVIREGQDVKEGDLLFEIDPRPFRNALLSAEADLQKARVQLETARAQVERYRSLTTDQMVSKEQFEKITDAARALEAEVTADESRVANARLQLEYCSIRAPLAGRTGNINVHEGDIVRANDSGTPLVTINQLSPIYVTFGVPQQYLAALTRYRSTGTLRVAVVPPGLDEKPEQGELTFLDNTVDSATGTLKLKGTFPNSSHRLWPGQFATVTLTLATPQVLAIPGSAIQNSQSGQYVYVVKPDRTAELRPVVIERQHEGDAVITRGLTAGETVVIEGQLRVIAGAPVDIKSPAGAPPSREGEGGGGAKKKKKSAEKEQPSS
ncbi:MAG: efflux RND transporter periplasmic adaptor subunit [Verrucomicrobia bacterium]|nr:efflux RND transporter periplasmic adaptor subunit [Verrucomicrobiota bacterium]